MIEKAVLFTISQPLGRWVVSEHAEQGAPLQCVCCHNTPMSWLCATTLPRHAQLCVAHACARITPDTAGVTQREMLHGGTHLALTLAWLLLPATGVHGPWLWAALSRDAPTHLMGPLPARPEGGLAQHCHPPNWPTTHRPADIQAGSRVAEERRGCASIQADASSGTSCPRVQPA